MHLKNKERPLPFSYIRIQCGQYWCSNNTLGTMVRFCMKNVPPRFTILSFCTINSYQFECAYAIFENDNNSNSNHTLKPLHPKHSTTKKIMCNSKKPSQTKSQAQPIIAHVSTCAKVHKVVGKTLGGEHYQNHNLHMFRFIIRFISCLMGQKANGWGSLITKHKAQDKAIV